MKGCATDWHEPIWGRHDGDIISSADIGRYQSNKMFDYAFSAKKGNNQTSRYNSDRD